jgi:hypothetical protein
VLPRDQSVLRPAELPDAGCQRSSRGGRTHRAGNPSILAACEVVPGEVSGRAMAMFLACNPLTALPCGIMQA